MATAESFSSQLRADALEKLSNEFPGEAPFIKARERSMQKGEILSYTFESRGKNGKKNRFVRYELKVSSATHNQMTLADILDVKICSSNRLDSCN